MNSGTRNTSSATRFHQVLKEKHPEIQLVSSAGPRPDDKRFTFAWPKLRELKADIVDEHCYDKPAWFFASTRRYDSYDRNGPKVFFGEYAAQSDKIVSTKNRNNLECALAEAAFMTGLERNADVVRMACYAPLFAHTDAWQWTPEPDLGRQPQPRPHAELLRPADVQPQPRRRGAAAGFEGPASHRVRQRGPR